MIKAVLKCFLWFFLAFVVIMFVAAVNDLLTPAMKKTEEASMERVFEALKGVLYMLPTIVIMSVVLPLFSYKGLSGIINAVVDKRREEEGG